MEHASCDVIPSREPPRRRRESAPIREGTQSVESATGSGRNNDWRGAMDTGNVEDDQSKAVMLFGRDIRKIPCFKQSMLSGIYSGLAAGLATFMFTSRVKLSMNVALGSYMGVVVVYWCYCRYNYVMEKYAMQDLRNILQQTSVANTEEIKEVAQKP